MIGSHPPSALCSPPSQPCPHSSHPLLIIVWQGTSSLEPEKAGLSPREACHRLNVVNDVSFLRRFAHADLHPGNFKFSQAGDVQIFDLGTRRPRRHTHTHTHRPRVLSPYVVVVSSLSCAPRLDRKTVRTRRRALARAARVRAWQAWCGRCASSTGRARS